MKITDKDAIDRVKEILKNCSPQAKKAIQALCTPSPQIAPPPARSMKKEDIHIPPMAQTIHKVYDATKEHAGGSDEFDDSWLSSWLTK